MEILLSKNILFADSFGFDLALLILRLAIGVCFVVHGMGKLGLVGKGNLAGFTGWLASMGVPFPALQARAAMLTELAGGVLLAAGLFTRVSCVFLCFTMLVAAFKGHKGQGYLITNEPPGMEYAFNLAVIVLVIFLLGPGSWSLDSQLF